MNWREEFWQDISLIRLPLLGLFASLLTAIVGWWFVHNQLQDSRDELHPLQIRLAEFRSAADNARTAWLDVRTNLQRYRVLEQRGVIRGEEHRLEWAEKLDTLQRTDPALRLHYRIEPQRQLENSQSAGNSALFSSRMTIKYAAVHEEVFSRLHRELGGLPGWLTPARCVIERPQETGTSLAVECDYEWISIASNTAAKAQGSPAR